MRTLLLLVCLLTGCVGTTYKLDGFEPIKQIVQDEKIPENNIATLISTCFVRDLSQFLDNYPPGSIKFIALLKHEQYHAKRQLENPARYANLYFNEFRFRWEEESAGWRIELEYLRDNGETIDAEKVADFLAYNPSYRSMVEHRYALEWVQNIINTRVKIRAR